MARESGYTMPIALHLDHEDTLALCVACIENGFSSVMIDGSHFPYEDNVALTRKVVDYAHEHEVTVEGELGVLAGIEDDVVAAIIADASEIFRPFADGKSIKFTYKHPESLPFKGNKKKMQRIVSNIIENAIKYTS